MRTFGRLLGFLRDRRGAVVLSLALAWLAMGATVAIPWLVGRTVDAIEGSERSEMWLLAGVLVGVAVLRLAISYARRIVAGRVSLGIEYDLRQRLYSHLQSLELGFFDRSQTGQLMSRATSDLQSIRFFLGYGLIFFTQHALTIVLAAAVMIAIDPVLAVLALAPVPVIVAAATRYGLRNRPAVQEIQQRLAELTAEAEETVSGIRIVKAFAREADRQARFAGATMRHFSQTMVSTRLRAFYNPLLGFLPTIGLVLVLFVGGRRVIDGQLSLGQFTAFYAYLLMLGFPMRMLGVSLGMAQRAIASGNRLFELLDREPRIVPPADPRPLPDGGGAVEVDGVSLAYGGGIPALDDVSLTVAPGERIALVGPTASGKTSLVQLIPRLYDPDRGRVLLDGVDVRELDPSELRRTVAIVADETFLFSATVGENIAYARPDATREELLDAARRAQALEFIERLPDGLDTVVGERGYTLSGGQRQRLAVARALIADPRVLILDDATSSVDSRTERAIEQGLGEALAGRTTFVIAHRLRTIARCDRVVVMDAGRIVDVGTHDELEARSELYREIAEKGLADSVFLQRDLERRETVGL